METMAQNNYHSVVKPFGQGNLPKGRMIDAKVVESRMLLERMNNLVED